MMTNTIQPPSNVTAKSQGSVQTSKALVVKVPPRFDQHRSKSYEMLRIPDDQGGYRQGFRLHCGKCSAYIEVTNEWWASTRHVTTKFERQGWIVNERNVTWCVCPSCQIVKKPRPAEPQEYPLMTSNVVKHTDRKQANGAFTQRELDTTDHAALPVAVEVLPSISVKPALVPVLNSDQKARLRQLLDRVFDDSKGCYLDTDGVRFTDAVVGEKCNLPTSAVKSFRDAAYGPLTSDPEIEALRVSIAGLQRAVEAELGRIEQDRVKLTSVLGQLVEIKQRTDRTAARLAQS